MAKALAQLNGESAIAYLRRAIGWLDHEEESLLTDLPSTDAALDYFALWAEYGTEFWTGILECIYEGDDPAKARAFVSKHKLPESWGRAIDTAVKQHAPKTEGR